MKTNYIILLIIVMTLAQISFSQSLNIKGFFMNSKNESIQVDYLLLLNNEVVYSGSDKKIKFDLELNSDYILIVSKRGFITKSVTFSTYTNDKEQFSFEFDMYLKDEMEQKNNLTTVSTKVFYDAKLRAFNYTISNKQYSQH